MSSFVVFRAKTFAQLTPEELTNLQAKIQTLEPMDMKIFNEKLKLINEDYPLTLPLWLILSGHDHIVKTCSSIGKKNTE